MTRPFLNGWTYILLVLLAVELCGCSSDGKDEPAPLPSGPTPQIIVMYAPGGLGDQGYNDAILAGVQSFKKTHHSDVEIYQYSPDSFDEAERLLTDWLSLPESDNPALFVVGSNDYESLVAEALDSDSLTKNKCLLMFESDNPKHLPVTHFRLSMYGASYLAGVTAAASIEGADKDVLVLLAHYGDETIAKAEAGFRDGFQSSGGQSEVFTECLAQDWTGYISAQAAYQRMDEWSKSYSYIFPVAGGSNQGIYRYTREHADAPLTAGMDVDQSGMSRNIVGSVTKNIDQVIYYYMETWLATGELPESSVFGLESGYTDWVLSPYHEQYRAIVDAARAEAVRKEVVDL